MSIALIWIVIGILLILSELLLTSVIAVFLGIGAIVTGLLLHWNIIAESATQFAVFGVVSLALLLVARGQFKRWFMGYTTDEDEAKPNFQRDIGARVKVIRDFNHGAGRVVLNGVQWDAFSEDELKAGETAWVLANEGIQLTVARDKPTQQEHNT
ncbi:NfeD family protein [Pseudidiomarina terrestris]|uniref:NfeD family protein n=1 Tax=Pseudidiomarina terrestris TaxID=2820060 RepID=A0AAW7QX79_9GAMM|nr:MULTISPECIES: NfeD family protein [unclassified Pseudidiomarina]MDN7123683.1 NfeD family protein [Pseudidiomarina sp. 1APP75-32.1]MDN7126527.1 NfeD family protein [Pseudidiomarina sp. 1APR75-33.1]MDN7128593.1 NfeD family protein [Pseudidiomarina sp. 1APR75-15]MDN7135148.1 NfeD family protein [Pseudidiomarina sp. 1ASP75-5]MDN7137819.1 NfeD family protein [Pseudidiomarina sp. 1ASP75-14]